MLGIVAQIVAYEKEDIVEHDIVDSAFVEGVPAWAESLLIEGFGGFVGSCISAQVMIPHQSEERESRLGAGLMHAGHQAAGPFAAYISAGYAERRETRLGGVGGRIGCSLADVVKFAFVVDLHVGPDEEVVAGLVLAGGAELEVHNLRGVIEFPVEERRAVALGHFVTGWDGDVHELGIRMNVKGVGTLFVTAHNAVAVSHFHSLKELPFGVTDSTAHRIGSGLKSGPAEDSDYAN